MQIIKQTYESKETDILYPQDGYVLQHKKTGITFGAVSLKDGRKQGDYQEIKQDDAPSED